VEQKLTDGTRAHELAVRVAQKTSNEFLMILLTAMNPKKMSWSDHLLVEDVVNRGAADGLITDEEADGAQRCTHL
jgi:hypothetical protein